MIPASTVFCQLHKAMKSLLVVICFMTFRVKPFTGSTNVSHKRFQLVHFAVYFAQLSWFNQYRYFTNLIRTVQPLKQKLGTQDNATIVPYLPTDCWNFETPISPRNFPNKFQPRHQVALESRWWSTEATKNTKRRWAVESIFWWRSW